MQLSGGPYSYNRFDAYESSLEEGSGASDPHKMKAKVDAAALKKEQESAALKKVDKKQEVKQEKETMDENLNTEETVDTVMENDQRMAMYSRALGVMGAHYSGPGFGVSPLEEKKQDKKDKEDESLGEKDGKESSKKQSDKDRRDESKGEKKADKDYDGDGEVESSKEEYFGSKDKAIKKAMAKEGYMPLPKEKMARQADKAYGKEQAAVKAGDEAGANKQMQRRIAMNDPKGRKAVMAKEEVSITKEMVVEYLVKEGYASNEVSAEILHTHVSDEFLAQIEEKMITD